MISSQARDGFRHFLEQAVKTSLANATPQCSLQSLPNLDTVKQKKTVVLTVATYLFRVLVFMYFTPDQATSAYFARLNGCEADAMSDQALIDAISECGNMCCGILNRELSAHFPHMGLSTPNIIDRRSAEYLDQLECGYIEHFSIDADEAVPLHLSLCVCEYADVDFKPDLTAAAETTGELELF